ncbi:TAXI family TRAP transporter solute-binding subunit [Desulfomarina sp.]
MKKTRTLRALVRIYGLGFFLVGMSIIVAYQFVEPAPPRSLKIATADKNGAYFKFANEYKTVFAKEGIDLQVVETSGSVENLKLLEEGRVEIAFVQGGVGRSEDYPELQGLASLYVEPLWIFLRNSIKVHMISQLQGLKIGAGLPGSGTRKIVSRILADNRLDRGQVTVVPIGGEEGSMALHGGEIDALCIVAGAESSVVKKLLLDPTVRLFNVRRAEAYTRIHKFLTHVVLPEGVIDMGENVPETDIHLVAPAATLVAGDNLHPAFVDLFMQSASKIHGQGNFLGDGKNYPSPEYLDFPLSPEAGRFYKNGPPFLRRFLPFWAASLVDRLKVMILPLIALIIPLMKVLPPTYRWRMRSKIYRWYDELHDLDQYVNKNPTQEVIAGALKNIAVMENEARQLEVPLSYARELYNLRLHIDLLRQQISGFSRN